MNQSLERLRTMLLQEPQKLVKTKLDCTFRYCERCLLQFLNIVTLLKCHIKETQAHLDIFIVAALTNLYIKRLSDLLIKSADSINSY